MTSAMIETLIAIQIAVAVGVIAVLALRLPVRRLVGAQLAFGLWALPVIAGLAVAIPGPVQLVPALEPVEIVAPLPTEATPVIEPSEIIPQAVPDTTVSEPMFDAVLSAITPGPMAWMALWALGVLVTVLVLGLRQYRYNKHLNPMQPAPELGPDVYRAGSTAVGAGLVGAARPKIIVPADFEQRFDATERALILDHEREHRRAGHAQLNALAALVQVLCWMNPLVHVAMRWFRLDQELACDAAVLKRSTNSARIYGAALLRAQMGVAAPFGCTWRPANGLRTRIQALGVAAPAGMRRGLGIAGLAVLFLGVGTASWAARPDIQIEIEGADAANASAQAANSGLTDVQLRGVNGRVRIIAEARNDIAIEGLTGEALTRRSGRVMRVQASDMNTDICERNAPVTQDFVLRVPVGVDVDIEGRMDAAITGMRDLDLRAEGCGTVDVSGINGDVSLDLGGSVYVRGQRAEELTVEGRSGPRVEFTEVRGPLLAVRTAGGVQISLESLERGGRFNLSGGSVISVEEWNGQMVGSVSGGSEINVEVISTDYAELYLSGASTGYIADGQVGELRVDQAANAQLVYGGAATTSHVRNRGSEPVIIASPGSVDVQGQIRTVLEPPAD